FLMSHPLAVLLAPARQRERRMGSNREEIEEKLRVLLNDVRRDKQSDTLHQRAITEMGQEYAGRFSRLRAEQQIIGTTAIAYPQLPSSSPWASDPLGPEMRIDATDCGDRLNYSIDALGSESCLDPPSEDQDQDRPSLAGLGSRSSSSDASPQAGVAPPLVRPLATNGGAQPKF